MSQVALRPGVFEMPRKLPRWPFGLAEGPPGSRPFAPLALLGSRWGARGVARGGPGGPRGNPTKLHVVFTGRGVLWSFVGGPCGVPRDLDGSPFDPSKWVDLFAGVPWASPGLSPGASWAPMRGPGGRQGGSRGPRGGSVGPLGLLLGVRGAPDGPRFVYSKAVIIPTGFGPRLSQVYKVRGLPSG